MLAYMNSLRQSGTRDIEFASVHLNMMLEEFISIETGTKIGTDFESDGYI